MYENKMPHLAELNGRKALIVDGKPFISLGLQWDCDGCYTPEEMDPFFAHGQKMGLNTASLLLYWREVEPVEGEYHLDMLTHRIEMARKHDMKIVLVWFASYKNGSLAYAPDYIRSDHNRFAKVVNKDGVIQTNCCCPRAEGTHKRDELALEAVFNHIKKIDGQEHTVVLFQIENEAGIFGTDRCYCQRCNEYYAQEDYVTKYGVRANETFTAKCIAEYCDSLTKTIKDIYDIPVYMNVWLDSCNKNLVPGVNYPSGSPIPAMLDICYETIKHIDFISPDIYDSSKRDFNYLCEAYSAHGRPLFIPETATGKGMRTEKNVFYAIADHSAIGYVPWAINRCCPPFMSQPLVNTIDGRWSDEAYELHKSYRMIRDAMIPIALAQNTPNLKSFVQEECEYGIKLPFGDVDVEVLYDHPENAARGLVIRRSEDEFIILGAGVFVCFSRAGGERVSMAEVESGAFEDNQWVARHAIARQQDAAQPIQLRDCRVMRVKLGKRLDYIEQ